MLFFLLISLLLPIYTYGADAPLPFENGTLPILKNEMTTAFMQENGICVPELCYAVSNDPQKNPLLIVGASPCIAAFIKWDKNPKVLSLHISAHNDLNAMIQVINNTFEFHAIKEKPLLYITLFTLTNQQYTARYNSIFKFFQENDHSERFEAIVKKLQENYVINNRYYMDYESSNKAHQDRNLICDGFDEQNKHLQVYLLDLKKHPVFGKNFKRFIEDFVDKVIIKLCHENMDKVTQVQEEQSNFIANETSLRLGNKWDYSFSKVTGPNIKALLEGRGQDLIESTPQNTREQCTHTAATSKKINTEKTVSPELNTQYNSQTPTTTQSSLLEQKKPSPKLNDKKSEQSEPGFFTRWYNAAKQRITNSITWFNVATAVGLTGLAGWLYTKWGHTPTPSVPTVEQSALTRKLLSNTP